MKLTVTNSAQNEDLVDFPVLVVLNPSKITYSDFDVDGSDIRFIDAMDSTTIKSKFCCKIHPPVN